MLAAGFYPDMSAEEYFDDPAPEPSLNQSLISTLLDKTAHHAAYEHPRLNPYRRGEPGEKTQWLGSAVHRLALGRGQEISVVRYPDYASSSAREARDLALANNRIPILERDMLKARDMATIVKRKITEVLEGAAYQTEVVMLWQEQTAYGPIWCRGMLDVWCEEKAMALDPKILRISATPKAFGKTAGDFGYDVQDVFYRRGLAVLRPDLKERLRFANLVVENTEPHGAQLLEPGETTRYAAERDAAAAMELWAKCLHSRTWPSYEPGIKQYETTNWRQQAAINR